MMCKAGLHEVLGTAVTDYCPECATCELCGSPLTATELRWSETQGTIAHPRCLATQLPISNGPVIIDQKTFDVLNAARLLIEPLSDLSEETNRYDAECRLMSSRMIHEMTLEQKFLLLARMEAISAAISLVLSKDYKRIKGELTKRDKAAFEKAVATERSENRPKAEKKQLSARDKAVKALMSAGLSESAAIESVDSQLIKQGKVIN